VGKAWTDAICRRIPVNLPATGQLRGGLRCRSEDLCRDPAITLEEFHGVAVGILDENGANSEIKRFIGRGDVAPMRLIDSELIWAQAVSQKQAGDLFEPSDFQSEVSRRVNFFKVGAGRHQVNRKMIPSEKPVWLLFAGCEAKNSDVERFCAVHIFDRNADVVQAFDKQIGAPSATSTKTKFANRAWFGKMEASFANNLLFRLDLRKCLALNAAQCGQVIDAYSVIVTKALAGPSAMSGSDIGLATSDALRAIASAIRRSRENPARAASPISDRAVVKTRRVMNNSPLRNSTPVCSENLTELMM
jgi:hypothetical protein